jgi:hypothetical protein
VSPTMLVGIWLVARDFSPSCGSQEKAAIIQFTHYGGREAGKDLDIYRRRTELARAASTSAGMRAR